MEFYLWVTAYPHWAEGVVFLVALLESLAVVGLFVPGVAMMFGAGALIGLGAMPFWPICLWAIAGAVVGDGLSFWIGWRFRSKLASFWPLCNYPQLLQRGVAFFQRYGDLSILLGRFVGPIRAVIPLVAGMLAMPPARFAIVNLLSAALWAPTYLLPGVVFGASLELAAKVTGRLALVLILVLALVWVGVWLSRCFYLYFQPKAHKLLELWFDFNRYHPLMHRLTSPLLYPWQRDYFALILLGALLAVAWAVLARWLPAGWELSLKFLHNPWSDAFFLAVEQLASWPTLLFITVILGAWLLLSRCYSELVHWLVSLGFCGFAEQIVGPFGLDRPILRAGVGYGFLVLMLTTWITPGIRLLIYAAVIPFWLLLIFARLYVGTVALRSLAMTVMVVIVWLGIAGIGYRRHASQGGIRDLGWLATSILMAAALGFLLLGRMKEIEKPVHEIRRVTEAAWTGSEWRRFPRRRQALLGRVDQPLILQWTAFLPKIQEQLQQRGWQPAQKVGVETALYWLVPQVQVREIPVLPHFNDGQAEAIILLKDEGENQSLILRLWPSGATLIDQVPIWLGTVARLKVSSALWGLVRFAEEVESSESEAVEAFLRDLQQDLSWCPLVRQDEAGYVWLIRRCS